MYLNYCNVISACVLQILLVLDSQPQVKLNPFGHDGLITIRVMHLGGTFLNNSKETFTRFIPSIGNLTNFRGCFQSVCFPSFVDCISLRFSYVI